MKQDFRALKSRKFPTHLQKVSKKLDSKNFYRVFRKILRRVGNHVVQKNQKKLQRRRFWQRRFSSFFQKSARRSKFTRLVLFLDRKIFHWRTLHERSIWASALCAALLFCQTSASLPKGAAPPKPVFLRFYSGFLCRVPGFQFFQEYWPPMLLFSLCKRSALAAGYAWRFLRSSYCYSRTVSFFAGSPPRSPFSQKIG